jgi:SAM-dependent methyltransferase
MEPGHCPVHPDAPLAPVLRGRDQAWGFEGEFAFGRCAACETWVLDPRPEPAELGRYYGRYYTEAMCAAYAEPYRSGKKPEAAGALDLAKARAYIDKQAATGRPFQKGQRLLDVGSGLGGFLRFVRDRTGVEVRGVDFDPACAKFAREIHEVEIDSGDLADQKYPDESFDVVTIRHCLEHVPDPLAQLAEIRRILRPGGTLHVEVPTAGLLARLFRGRWAFLQPPTHFFHFRESALRSLLEQAGYAELRLTRPWLPGELSFSLLLALGLDGVIPLVVLPADTLGKRLIKVLFVLSFLVDLPVTALLALFGKGGVLEAVARRPER